ncbi:MAG: hypothetical protein IKK74_11865 [Clostridia bacterium]|nr:hypothetical protein [Clostridia bacterium]
MKYKKWWIPAVFMVISAVFFVAPYLIISLFFKDDAWAGIGYVFLCMGIWFFFVLPVLSLIYPRRVIYENRERFLLTVYNSFLIILPLAVYSLINSNYMLLIYALIAIVWSEMWALLGLAGKGDKKADVWYVPAFLAVAVLVVNMWLQYFVSKTFLIAILSCVICPIAIAIYARICVRDRKSKIFFTVYASLAVFVAIFGYYVYSIIDGTLELGDSALNTVWLILSAIGTFILYELAALIGAGVKIKLPKRKKKAKKEEEKPETLEVAEEAKE